MTCSSYLITSIPKFKFLPWYKFKNNNHFYILDTSLIEFTDKRAEITGYVEWLKSKGVIDSNITIVGPLEYEEERWLANIEGLKVSQDFFSNMMNGDFESKFAGNYLAHVFQMKASLFSYEQRVIKDFENKGIKLRQIGRNNNLSSRQLGSLGRYFDFLIVLIPVLILLVNYVRKNIVFSQGPVKKSYGGICVDLVHCHVYNDDGNIDIGGGSDAFLLQGKEKFSIGQFFFLSLGWVHKKEIINPLRSRLENDGAVVIGEYGKKVILYWKDILKCTFSNLLTLWKILLKGPKPKGGWGLQTYKFIIKYLFDRFRAQIAFNNSIPSVYLSRLDYNYLHHPVASVCKEKNISYAGMCHSPSGGAAHIPQMSILSFERFYIYSDFFSDKLYPTWNNNYTELLSIGIWRTDYIHQCQSSNTYQQRKKVILDKLSDYYVVALHLPVPESYLFREEDVKRWMDCFEKILLGNKKLYFVLFPRRHENSPIYFKKLIEQLCSEGRAKISSNLEPEWKGSYPWTLLCDLVVGCTFSDTVLEAWSVGTPAVSYSDIGKGRVELEKFNESLRLYNCDDMETLLENASIGKWSPHNLSSEIKKKVTGTSTGNGFLRLADSLEGLIKFRYNVRN